jgi:DnaJ family protein C protein 28
MDKKTRSIEEQIRQAIQEGQFDNLPGKGKPLVFNHNPHEDPTWRMAFSMLRSSGHTLPWIQTRKDIEAELAEVQRSLARTWRWRHVALEQNQPPDTVEGEWQRALGIFITKIKDLNKRIADYNLAVPSDQFKRRTINANREVEKITSQLN